MVHLHFFFIVFGFIKKVTNGLFTFFFTFWVLFSLQTTFLICVKSMRKQSFVKQYSLLYQIHNNFVQNNIKLFLSCLLFLVFLLSLSFELNPFHLQNKFPKNSCIQLINIQVCLQHLCSKPFTCCVQQGINLTVKGWGLETV